MGGSKCTEEDITMKALRSRLMQSLAVAGCLLLAAQPPVAAQAAAVPTISVLVDTSPQHLHVQGRHFTPGSLVEVHAEYYPMIKGTIKSVTSSTAGTIIVNLPVLALRCGVETVDVSASYNPYALASNLVIRKVDFGPC